MHIESLQYRQLDIQDWHIEPGQCWAVIGRNGSGKRQLGQVLAGLSEEAPQGRFDLSHDQVRILSFDSQQAFYEKQLQQDDTDFMDHLDPGTTVREILGVDHLPPDFSFLGLEALMDRGYRLLSSGESRKALLVRELLSQPDFLILEEPYDSLDIQAKQELDHYFSQLVATGKPQMLFLLNTWEELSEWHSHVAVIEQGRLLAQGPREQLAEDSDLRALLAFDPDTLPPWPENLSLDALPDPLVKLNQGHVKYGDDIIFEGIDLLIAPGDHTLLTGRNGSGKSTLLSLISGDHPQCYGNEISVLGFRRGQGESIWQVKQRLGLVSPSLHRDHRVPGSALEIVCSGFFDSIGLYDAPSAEQQEHARHWLSLVGLADKETTAFKQLPYGEQRLCLIARALAKQPALLLLDEPTQGLDEINRHRLIYFLEHLSAQKRSTIVMASHRLDEQLPLFQHHLHLH